MTTALRIGIGTVITPLNAPMSIIFGRVNDWRHRFCGDVVMSAVYHVGVKTAVRCYPVTAASFDRFDSDLTAPVFFILFVIFATGTVKEPISFAPYLRCVLVPARNPKLWFGLRVKHRERLPIAAR